MSKFACVESDRILSLLDEAIEKIQLLSALPALTLDPDANHLIRKKQARLVQEQDPDGAFALENQFLVEDNLIQQVNRLNVFNPDEEAYTLAKTQTRSVCRVFQKNLIATSLIHAEQHNNQVKKSMGLSALALQVAAVRKRVQINLSTSVEQDEMHRILMSDMNIRIREAEHDYKQMAFEVRAQHEARETESRRNLKKILALKTELYDIEQGNEQANALIDQDSKQTEFTMLNTFEEDIVRLREDEAQLTNKTNQLDEQHFYTEAGHRKKNLKGAVELSNLIEKYDTEMATLQNAIDEMKVNNAKDVAEIHRLSEHFTIMDENDRRAAAEYIVWDKLRKAREAKEAKFMAQVAKIQARFRGYLTRLHLKNQAKKKKKRKKAKPKKKF
ncbi:hypothetical protein THRCLA_04372 [Thraustotheca clavata]|uniref:Dynein regulatory complex protein 10 n=1 Tax=Thraustotheca clavata TaxID=74557 RepID=A0A1V9ZZY2_9STRA|nr:hypothetical protein THRCLA_04372 [Thraustotheca clavata]